MFWNERGTCELCCVLALPTFGLTLYPPCEHLLALYVWSTKKRNRKKMSTNACWVAITRGKRRRRRREACEAVSVWNRFLRICGVFYCHLCDLTASASFVENLVTLTNAATVFILMQPHISREINVLSHKFSERFWSFPSLVINFHCHKSIEFHSKLKIFQQFVYLTMLFCEPSGKVG